MSCKAIAVVSLTVASTGCIAPAPYRGADIQHPPAVGPVAASSRPLQPVLRRLPNGHYRVRQPWLVELNGRRWLVPKGYTSNGITGPPAVRKSLGDGVNHPETWAAVFHDWLFTRPGMSRATADRLFLELLLAYGVPPQKARLMHATVSAYSLSKSFR